MNERPVAFEFPGNERREMGRGEERQRKAKKEIYSDPRRLKGRREDPKNGRGTTPEGAAGLVHCLPKSRTLKKGVINQAEALEESSTHFRHLRTLPPAMHWAGGARQKHDCGQTVWFCLSPRPTTIIIEVWMNQGGGIRIDVHGSAGAMNTGKERAARCGYSGNFLEGTATPQDNVGDGGSPQGSRPSEVEGRGRGRSEAREKEENEGGGDPIEKSAIRGEEGGEEGGGGGDGDREKREPRERKMQI